MSAPGAGRLVLPDAAAERLSALLARTAGLVVDGPRRGALSHDVALRLRATGLELPDYLALVESPGARGEAERAALVDEVTIGETSFFRNAPQMTALRDVLLPELAARAADEGRPLRIWSAGCSTGEEPYTLAMLLRELLDGLPRPARPEVELLATDVSRTALAAARSGRYRGRAAKSAQRAGLAAHFLRAGDEWQVLPEVRALVDFASHNLVTEPPPFPAGTGLDLVLCRNVTIYFARETTRALVGRFARCLHEGGYLVLGHAESLWQLSDEFGLVAYGDAFAYRRLAAPGAVRPVSVRPVPMRPAERPVPRPAAVPQRAAAAPTARAAGTLLRPHRPSETQAQPPEGDPAPRPSLAAGLRLLARGAATEALDLGSARTAEDPMDALGHCLRGRALSDLGRDAEAATALRAAVYADPSCGAAHFLLAVALGRLRQVPAAAVAYATAADLLDRFGDPSGLVGIEGRDVAELAALCRARGGRRVAS